MCFALKRMRSYPQAYARKLCKSNTGCAKGAIGTAFSSQCVQVPKRIDLWKSRQPGLKAVFKESRLVTSHESECPRARTATGWTAAVLWGTTSGVLVTTACS